MGYETGPWNFKTKQLTFPTSFYGNKHDLIPLLSRHTVYSISRHRFVAQLSMQILIKGAICHKNDDSNTPHRETAMLLCPGDIHTQAPASVRIENVVRIDTNDFEHSIDCKI